MTADFMEVVTLMRKNKHSFDVLDLDQDVELTARRMQLGEDIKVMVSSLRIFKWDMAWTWNCSGFLSGQRACTDISWVDRTITSSPGTKCAICAAS